MNNDSQGEPHRGVTRRGFLTGTGAAAAVTSLTGELVSPAVGQENPEKPGVTIYLTEAVRYTGADGTSGTVYAAKATTLPRKDLMGQSAPTPSTWCRRSPTTWW